ncbi:DUF2855 family protein [Candidatus Poriferisocius sp.]|uniref:DUF2855 family protein n=1 Tax=Candidatus Poriferisocius sp. TaxID=3101276 RepID=UPI003B02EAAF
MDFEVNRQDFRDTRTVDSLPVKLAPGQIRLAVERFALTANNVTYAVAGDMLDYWGFFPTEAPWGRIPAMGLGSVVESAHPDISTGGRFFGFYPMCSEVVIEADPRGTAFTDVGAHRAKHAEVYTNFSDIAADIMFRDDRIDEFLLLRGLFMTSFLADDYLGDRGFHDASQTLITSASSKTSICLAACLARRGHRSVGLTSPRNRAFVEGLGLYDEVLVYDEIDQLDPTVATGLVDMAGSDTVRSGVHTRFGDGLRFSMTIGATHWEDTAPGGTELPGPQPTFFFAPDQIAKRSEEWGAAELMRRIAAVWHELLDGTDRWLTVVHRFGPQEITAVYHDLLEGRSDPSGGFVASMSGEALR